MPDTELACTFCGRPQRKARKLIAGPGVYICDGCVELAVRVVSSGSAAGTPLGHMHAVLEIEPWATASVPLAPITVPQCRRTMWICETLQVIPCPLTAKGSGSGKSNCPVGTGAARTCATLLVEPSPRSLDPMAPAGRGR